MSKASLAAHYRPQTFSQVVGQDMVKTVLSRAALEDRVAPAYLLSGTRGVGKTTIARIFAKALNCAQAPAGEPCNECDACRRITQGNFVDVVEIDGASNRGIDDIRRLRDAVGYAPMEGRYKVFIIDEAHMLTKEAFNALLKTLEEPPARVTFIMATTEQHKFPVTIVSRCQHFVFRQISETVLEEHVRSILQKENRAFEPDAAKLIARRASGSVRDAMSLLGQTLALGLDDGASLTAEQARTVLGLAGREVMDRLMTALAAQDATAIATLVRELLGQGVDMGFFLRELGALWRDMFMLRQTENSSALGFPQADLERLSRISQTFSLSYIHAAWQMTLDAQRKILTSLEPAAGLELLLLNLAMLPRLLPLAALDTEKISPATPSGVPPAVPSSAPPGRVSPEPPSAFAHQGSSPEPDPGERVPPRFDSATPVTGAAPWEANEDEQRVKDEPLRPSAESMDFEARQQEEDSPDFIPAEDPLDDMEEPAFAPVFSGADSGAPGMDPVSATFSPKTGLLPSIVPEASSPVADKKPCLPDEELTWEKLVEFSEEHRSPALPSLHQFRGEIVGGKLRLHPASLVLYNQIRRKSLQTALTELIEQWSGRSLELVYIPPVKEMRNEGELKEELERHPSVQALQKHFDATVLRCTPAENNGH